MNYASWNNPSQSRSIHGPEVYHTFMGNIKVFTVYCPTNQKTYQIVKGTKRQSLSEAAFNHWPHRLIPNGSTIYAIPMEQQQPPPTNIPPVHINFNPGQPLPTAISNPTRAAATHHPTMTPTPPRTTQSSPMVTPPTNYTINVSTAATPAPPSPSPSDSDIDDPIFVQALLKQTKQAEHDQKQPAKNTVVPKKAPTAKKKAPTTTKIDSRFFTKVKEAAKPFKIKTRQQTLDHMIRMEDHDLERAIRNSLEDQKRQANTPIKLDDSQDDSSNPLVDTDDEPPNNNHYTAQDVYDNLSSSSSSSEDDTTSQ